MTFVSILGYSLERIEPVISLLCAGTKSTPEAVFKQGLSLPLIITLGIGRISYCLISYKSIYSLCLLFLCLCS